MCVLVIVCACLPPPSIRAAPVDGASTQQVRALTAKIDAMEAELARARELMHAKDLALADLEEQCKRVIHADTLRELTQKQRHLILAHRQILRKVCERVLACPICANMFDVCVLVSYAQIAVVDSEFE